MKLKLITTVKAPYKAVVRQFNQTLFLKLNPPFPIVKLHRFDGMSVNDEIHLELNLLFAKMPWVSVITEATATDQEMNFTDRGVQLPFFLRSWKHLHRIIKQGEHTLIVDDITFQGNSVLMGYLIWPLLYLQFCYRKPIYKHIARECRSDRPSSEKDR